MSNFLKRTLSSIILIPLVYFFLIQESLIIILFSLFLFVIASFEWHTMEKNKYIKTYGIIFLFFSFYTFYVVSENKWNILFIISICISTDIGGYVFGKIFKGPKLTKISPNKTYAGMIGGYVLSLIFLTLIFNYTADNKTTQIQFYIMIIIISTVSQVGDIIVSFFKRKSKIKNTGMIIPGHGGLLDRIDGMIFAFPSYYLIKLNDYIII